MWGRCVIKLRSRIIRVNSLMQTDDEALVERFLAGDDDAAQILATWVRVATWSFRERFGADWEDARQEALLQVTRALRDERYQGRGSVKAYVRRIATTTCLDRLRWRRRWRFTDIEGADLPRSRDKADSSVVSADLMKTLCQVLAAVPEECRQLWRMIIDGMSYREMSRHAGVAEGTLRVRVLRCRKRATEARARAEGGSNPGDSPGNETGSGTP